MNSQQTEISELINAIRRDLHRPGNSAVAESTVTAALSKFPKAPQLILLASEVATARGDLRLAVERAREAAALAKEAQRPRFLAWLAEALNRAGEPLEAEAVAAEALRLAPTSQRALRAAASIAGGRGDFEAAIQYLRASVSGPDAESRSYLQLAQLEHELARPDAALALADQALERWPNDPWLLHLKGIAARSAGLYDISRQAAQALLQISDAPESLKAASLLHQAEFGSFVEDVAGLSDHGEEVLFRPTPASNTLLIVFTGLADQATLPLVELHARLSRLGISVVYLRDRQRLLYLNGIQSLGDGYEATLKALRKIAADCAAQRILCFGGSAGGYGAVLYGLDLGAEAVLTLSGPTTLEPQVLAEDGRGRAVVSRLQKLVPHMTINLRPRVAAAPLRITAYFGNENAQDRMHARNLEGLANVDLRPQSDVSRHDLGAVLMENGRLEEVLRDFLTPAGRQ